MNKKVNANLKKLGKLYPGDWVVLHQDEYYVRYEFSVDDHISITIDETDFSKDGGVHYFELMTSAFPTHMPEEMEINLDAPTLEELFKEYDEVIELKISDLETMRENLLKIRRKSK
jgi:hypothetical protein